MGSLDLNKVESDLLASFDCSDVSVLHALDVILGHGDGFRIVFAKGDITGTVNYSIDRVNENQTVRMADNRKPLSGQPFSSSSARCLGALTVSRAFS